MTTKEAKQRRRTKAEQRAESLEQILDAAEYLFAEHGLYGVTLKDVAKRVGVHTSLLHYYFADKKALFDAVVVALQIEAAAKIEARAKTQRKVWDRLTEGIDAYLDACLEPAYGRIVIQEAPIVLGNARTREIEETYPMALLTATLAALKRQGELDFEDIDLLSRMVDAMICKMALLLPEAENPKKLRARGQKIIAGLLDGFRTT